MTVPLGGQFSQPTLPGVDAGLPRRTSKPEPQFVNNVGRTYSGPIPGQMVMGVHNLGGDALNHVSRGGHQEPFYEVDPTGFVKELGDSGRHGLMRRFVSPVDISANHNVQQTVGLYRKWGGGRAGIDEVEDHWDRQPLHQIRSDAPIHTGQDWQETLYGDDRADVMYKGTTYGGSPPEEAEGRQRVNAIRASVQQGNPIRKAAWLVKRAGRLYSLDGHHRVLAAREEGLSHFPARVWDMDAEAAAKATPPVRSV